MVKCKIYSTLTLLALLCTLSSRLWAAEMYWIGKSVTDPNKWNVAANWSTTADGKTPAADWPRAADNVYIIPSANRLTSLGGVDAAANSLTIKSTYSNHTITDTAKLTIGSGGINMTAEALTFLIRVPILLAADQTWTINSINGLQFDRAVAGSYQITKSGTGLILANYYSGTAGGGTFGTNTLKVTDGTLRPSIVNVFNGTNIYLVGGNTCGTLDLNSATTASLTGATIIFDNAGTKVGTLTGLGSSTSIVGGNIQVNDNGKIIGTTGTYKFSSLSFTAPNKVLTVSMTTGNVNFAAINQTIAGTLDLAGSVNINDSTFQAPTTGATLLTKSNSGTLTFNSGAKMGVRLNGNADLLTSKSFVLVNRTGGSLDTTGNTWEDGAMWSRTVSANSVTATLATALGTINDGVRSVSLGTSSNLGYVAISLSEGVTRKYTVTVDTTTSSIASIMANLAAVHTDWTNFAPVGATSFSFQATPKVSMQYFGWDNKYGKIGANLKGLAVADLADAGHSTITPGTATLTADGVATQTIVVQARDANNNNLTTGGATVIISRTGGGTLSTTSDLGNGTYRAILTAPTATGSATITATLNGTSVAGGGTSVVTFLPGAADAAHSLLSPANDSLAADGISTRIIAVYTRDAFNNEISTGGATVAFNIAGLGTLSEMNNNGNGIYDVTLTAPTTTGSATITAMVNGVGIAGSSVISFIPGTLDHFVIVPIGTQTAGNPFGITITAKDANSNTITGFTGTVDIGALLGDISPAQSNNFVAGVLSAFNVTMSKSGTSQAINVIDHAGSGKSGISSSFIVKAGELHHFAISPVSSPQIAGGVFPLTVTAQDAGNNTVTSFTGIVELSTTAGIISPSTSNAFIAGVAADNYLVTGAGTGKIITASCNTITGSSDSFAVSAGPMSASKSNITISAEAVIADGNARTTITITAVDSFDNPIAGITDVVLSATDTGNMLTQPTTATDSNGRAVAMLASNIAGEKIISVKISGVAITETALVTFLDPATVGTYSWVTSAANGDSSQLSMSADGSSAAFYSLAKNLAADQQQTGDVLVYSDGALAVPNKGFMGVPTYPVISPNGSYVAFHGTQYYPNIGGFVYQVAAPHALNIVEPYANSIATAVTDTGVIPAYFTVGDTLKSMFINRINEGSATSAPACSADGRYVAYRDGTVVKVYLNNNELPYLLSGTPATQSLRPALGGEHLAILTEASVITVYNLSDGSIVRTFSGSSPLALSPNGVFLACANGNATVIYDVLTGQAVKTLGFTRPLELAIVDNGCKVGIITKAALNSIDTLGRNDVYTWEGKAPTRISAGITLPQTLNAGQTYSFPLETFTDNYSVSDNARKAMVILDATGINGGTIATDAMNLYFTPADDTLADSFSYNVFDGLQFGNSAASVTLTVNRRPLATGKDSGILNGNFDINVTTILNGDSDPDGDAFTLHAFDVITRHGGRITLDNGVLHYTAPVPLVYGTDSFNYTVIDANGAISLPAIVSFTLNSPPTLAIIADQTTDIDSQLPVITLVAGDVEDDDITLTWSKQDGAVLVTALNFTGTSSMAITTGNTAGMEVIRITVHDSKGNSSYRDFTLTVTPRYTITATAGANGKVSPTSKRVNPADEISFTAVPARGYEVNRWAVNSVVQQSGGNSFTLSNINSDQQVAVSFCWYDMSVTGISTTKYFNTGELRNLQINGIGFKSSPAVELRQAGQPAISGSFVKVNGDTSISCDFYFSRNNIGKWDIVITNTDDRTTSLVGALELTQVPPHVVFLTKISGVQGQAIATDVLGYGFADAAVVKAVQGGTTINSSAISHWGQNRLVATFTIPQSAPTGYYQVIVTNPDGASSVEDVNLYITANPAPLVTSISLEKATNNAEYPFLIRGANFNGAAIVTLTSATDSVTATAVVVAGGTITCKLNLRGKKTGVYDLTVTNPDGQRAKMPQAFVVIAPELTAVTLSVAPGSPILVGSTIPLMCTASYDAGVTGIDYAYYARYYNTATQLWVELLLSDFSPSATFNWVPTEALNYYLYAVAKIHETDKQVVSAELNYPITIPTLTGLTMTIGKKDANSNVLLTANKVGTAANVEYYFYGFNKTPGWTSFTIRTYNGFIGNTTTWTVPAPGKYKLQVLARVIGSTSAFQVASPVYDVSY